MLRSKRYWRGRVTGVMCRPAVIELVRADGELGEVQMGGFRALGRKLDVLLDELASLLGCSVLLAQRTAYCLRMINMVEPAGKRGRTPLHRRTPEVRCRLDRTGRTPGDPG